MMRILRRCFVYIQPQPTGGAATRINGRNALIAARGSCTQPVPRIKQQDPVAGVLRQAGTAAGLLDFADDVIARINDVQVRPVGGDASWAIEQRGANRSVDITGSPDRSSHFG